MEIYILDNNFSKTDVLDEYVSAIWTERFTSPGDVTIVGGIGGQVWRTLGPNIFLGLEGSDEVMMIDTVLEEEGTVKATGSTITRFLDERFFRASYLLDDPPTYTLAGVAGPGEAMGKIVDLVCVPGGPALPWPNTYQTFAHLTLGAIDATAGDHSFELDTDTVLAHVSQLADTYKIGFKIYLYSSDPAAGTYSLKFTTYRGRDLTTDQNTYPTVRFSPSLDSLTGVSKLESNVGYKTIVYAFAPEYDDGVNPNYMLAPGHAEVTGGLTGTDFYRRELMIDVSDATYDNFESAPAISTYLTQKAKDELANNNYTKVHDGEIVPQNMFTYGEDYKLGDVIELGSGDEYESVETARIVEYIRTQDQEGERAYPTISVIT